MYVQDLIKLCCFFDTQTLNFLQTAVEIRPL